MSKKGNLFYLIKSLTKSEKRYFKLFCFDQKTNNNYLKLFEVYDKMEVLEEEKIRQKFKEEKFIKQLHVTKNYLYHQILDSLRHYHSKLSKDAEIKDILRNVEVLFSKELFNQCEYELQRAEKLAIFYEKQTALLEITGWKRQLILTQKGLREPILKEISKSENETLAKLKTQQELWKILPNIFEYSREKKEIFWEFESIKEENSATFLQSKVLRHHILYTYFTINNEPKKALKNLKELVEILEAEPARITENPSPYVTALNNLIGFYLSFKRYDEVTPILEKVKAVPKKYKLEKERKFTLKLRLRMYNVELEILRDLRKLEEGVVLIEEIQQFLAKNEQKIMPVYALLLWYQFSNIFFMKGDLQKSLKWVNEILNRKFNNERADLERYARLLNLMIHFELGNIFVLKYSVDSCRRFLKKKKNIEPFEQRFLKFFSKICNAPRAEYKTHFRALHQDFFEGEKPMITANHLDYLDLKSWVKRKI